MTDIPMRDIVGVMLAINAHAYSFEAGNVRHEHEWKVWQEVKLPDDKLMLPGVVSHATNVVEHPELVAERILRFANIVGQGAGDRLDRLRAWRAHPSGHRVGEAGGAGAGGGAGQPATVGLTSQRGSGGRGASVAKRNIVVERNSCPGFNSVVGKFGLLGLSGKCCVSSVNASVWRYVVPDEPTTEPFRPLLV